MKKNAIRLRPFDFHTIIQEDCCPLGFPVGSRIKGHLVPFKIASGSISPGQVVAVRTEDGRTVARFYHSSSVKKVVAIVRAVFLPTGSFPIHGLEAWEKIHD